MAAYGLRNLKDPAKPVPPRFAIPGDQLDAAAIGTVMAAPWRAMEVVTLAGGEQLGPRELVDSEVLLYVTAGRGLIRAAGREIEVGAGESAVFLRGETLEVHGIGDEPFEAFRAEIGVPGA